MTPYFRILAWRIPWTGKLSGLQSLGLQRAGQCRCCFPSTAGSIVWSLQVYMWICPFSLQNHQLFFLSWLCIVGLFASCMWQDAYTFEISELALFSYMSLVKMSALSDFNIATLAFFLSLKRVIMVDLQYHSVSGVQQGYLVIYILFQILFITRYWI